MRSTRPASSIALVSMFQSAEIDLGNRSDLRLFMLASVERRLGTFAEPSHRECREVLSVGERARRKWRHRRSGRTIGRCPRFPDDSVPRRFGRRIPRALVVPSASARTRSPVYPPSKRRCRARNATATGLPSANQAKASASMQQRGLRFQQGGQQVQWCRQRSCWESHFLPYCLAASISSAVANAPRSARKASVWAMISRARSWKVLAEVAANSAMICWFKLRRCLCARCLSRACSSSGRPRMVTVFMKLKCMHFACVSTANSL